MPQKLEFPSGTVYELSENPTQSEIDQVVAYEMKRITMQDQWAKASPLDRIGLLAKLGAKTLAEIGIEGTGAALGQAAGTAMGGPVVGSVGGAVGGAIGNAIVQGRRMHEGEQEDFKPGEAAGAAIGGAIPGGTLAKQNVQGVLRQGAKNAIGNMGATTVQRAVDEGRPPSLDELNVSAGTGFMSAPVSKLGATGKKAAAEIANQAENAVRDKTMRMAVDLGYTLDPALANPNMANKLANRIAGATQVQRAAVFKNQKITNAIARAEIGMKPDQPLSLPEILQRKFEIEEPYREVAQISPLAEDTLKELQRTRLQARMMWQKSKKESDIDLMDKAAELDKKGEALENKLESFATNAGKTGLVDELREARRLSSKAHVVLAALNKADGNVSSTVIGAMYDKGKLKLTDGLEVIGRLENAMPQVMKEAAVTQAVGSQSFRPFLAAAAGTYGYQIGGAPGALLGASIPALGDIPVRAAMLSSPYQKFMDIPRYNTQQAGIPESVLRFSTQALGR